MTKKTDYLSLQNELDEILATLQDSETDIDMATKKYERGLVVIKELENYLEKAENNVKELKAKFDK